MILIVTPLAAAALVALYVRLTLGVVKIRYRDRVSLGDDGNDSLQKAIRAHANLGEWAPLALILLAVLEINGASVWICAPLAIAFVLDDCFTLRASHHLSLMQSKSAFLLCK